MRFIVLFLGRPWGAPRWRQRRPTGLAPSGCKAQRVTLRWWVGYDCPIGTARRLQRHRLDADLHEQAGRSAAASYTMHGLIRPALPAGAVLQLYRQGPQRASAV